MMEGTNTDSDDLYQIAILIDQLKHDDVQQRTAASKNISKIARALGPDRTRDELIPFLTECVDDEDEVIVVIAEELGKLCNNVGGSAHVHKLLPPLELLICGEDNNVRSMSARSVELVVECMSDDNLCTYFFPFLTKLANKDWFTSRASAATLLHLGLKRLSAKMQEEVLGLFLRLCKDETPLVRRLAAQHLEAWASLLADAPTKQKELIAAFKNFINDDQDSIRIQIVPISIAIAPFVSAEVRQTDILGAVVDVSRDKSWRVRWSLAHRVHDAFNALRGGDASCSSGSGGSGGGKSNGTGGAALSETAQASLATLFNNLLNDAEAEVKGAAASHLSSVCRHLKKTALVEVIVPTAQRLSADPSEFVRSFFATEVNLLAPLLGKEDTVTHILPLLLVLLRDSNSEVRLNVISGLDSINAVIGVDLLSQSLMPAITDLAQDTKWRVRLAVIENTPMLAKQLGVQFFNEKLINLSLAWLGDVVFSIRKAAAQNIRYLTEIFGEDWARTHIVPRIREMQSNAAFAKRMTALFAVQVLLSTSAAVTFHPTASAGSSRAAGKAPVMSHSMVLEVLLPIVLAMASDPVPNIRFTVAKTLAHLAVTPTASAKNDALVQAEIAPVLAKLATDPDRDVRKFATGPVPPAVAK